jgi:hypothetical protein
MEFDGIKTISFPVSRAENHQQKTVSFFFKMRRRTEQANEWRGAIPRYVFSGNYKAKLIAKR